MKTRKHRLSEDSYIGEKIYFITIDLYAEYFRNEELIFIVKNILDATLKKYNIINLLTTFMYNHIHFILQGMNEKSNIKKCIKTFKSLVTLNADIKSAITKDTVFANFNWRGFWHKDFYDHIVRNKKSLSKIIRYVLENPVRKGYVKNYIAWRYSFSDKFDLKDFANVCYDSAIDILTL
ncbi:MAG: hypothetical protein COT22_00815 [Ignavibacteria bacterium CG08_land_8_20_14_0_20_37_9]|nr:MAG: hypothetical protein COT22_00815 [Ignavibacteria bacterium CG08_land_8_20_14_0_20_37_9]